eukprot:3932470-Rhodomonas_salina.1
MHDAPTHRFSSVYGTRCARQDGVSFVVLVVCAARGCSERAVPKSWHHHDHEQREHNDTALISTTIIIPNSIRTRAISDITRESQQSVARPCMQPTSLTCAGSAPGLSDR